MSKLTRKQVDELTKEIGVCIQNYFEKNKLSEEDKTSIPPCTYNCKEFNDPIKEPIFSVIKSYGNVGFRVAKIHLIFK
jgi:hypothetical protein